MSLQPKRLAEEGVPIAAILFFWYLLAVVASFQNVGGPVRTAGVVMATLYVAVRGAALSSEVLPAGTDDLRVVLYENARLAVPAGAWFLGSMFVYALDGLLYRYAPSPTSTTLGGGSRRDPAVSDDETPADD